MCLKASVSYVVVTINLKFRYHTLEISVGAKRIEIYKQIKAYHYFKICLRKEYQSLYNKTKLKKWIVIV